MSLEKEMMVDEVYLRVGRSSHLWGMLVNQDNRQQGRPSSGDPPVSVASVVGAAVKIPKIAHQMWAMTQFFSTWSL